MKKKEAEETKQLTFGVSDLLALEDVPVQEHTRTFQAKGRGWTVTCRNLADEGADSFFLLSSMIFQGMMGAPGEKVKEITVTPPLGDPITLKNQQYIGGLRFLEAVCSAPAFSFDEWAIFGKKLGGKVTDEVIDWAMRVNGFEVDKILGQLLEAKNASGGAG